MVSTAARCAVPQLVAPAGGGGRQRAATVRVAAQDKGFSGGAGQKLPKQVKKSKRGKVASRPSPKLTLEQLQAEQAQYEAAQRQEQRPAAGAAAAAADSDAEDAAPTTSGNRNVEYGSTAAVPEVVTDRMLKRVILFMGTPVFGGIMLFPFFYWLKIKQEIDLPNWVAYVSSSLTFGGGLLGISYGIMSASWDPRREGSLLGWTEFQANVPLLMDRFKRK
ncbi:hypothetical protein C2E20_0864 [Micractinium conductrix]|uniref:Uncharacterized protein n=1 Tax=Micractinium conductrix TaxID=554055 RepID=A0A2P6VQE2_9CHLO|nr:hypothetical protein C2E20_0864 [Micractinium conductrix]|eukprot:PSC76318.1 hypothetical protein C2E20_0864 [Micractinium conductrix]